MLTDDQREIGQKTTILIRPYAEADWQRLCEIHDAARLDELEGSVGEEAFLPLEETAVDEGLFDGQLDVAECGGQVMGFVAYTPEELTWLYVDPRRYRQGIGRALLRHAIEQAGPQLQTEVLEGNDPALRLYLSEGFTIVERVEGHLVGNEEFKAAGIIMEWSLA